MRAGEKRRPVPRTEARLRWSRSGPVRCGPGWGGDVVTADLQRPRVCLLRSLLVPARVGPEDLEGHLPCRTTGLEDPPATTKVLGAPPTTIVVVRVGCVTSER